MHRNTVGAGDILCIQVIKKTKERMYIEMFNNKTCLIKIKVQEGKDQCHIWHVKLKTIVSREGSIAHLGYNAHNCCSHCCRYSVHSR